MTAEQAINYCLSKRDAVETYPFDEKTLVFKIGHANKMFGLLYKREEEVGINLKLDPELAEILRYKYDGIIPAFHMNKKHWSTVLFQHDVPDEEIYNLIDLSYDIVFRSLTKKLQKAVLETE